LRSIWMILGVCNYDVWYILIYYVYLSMFAYIS
jgi:hypothetical protein